MAAGAEQRLGERMASPLFVGRRAELVALEAALAAGPTTAVLVGGEAGAGKTRLVYEFTTSAAATGIRVVAGACVALGAESLPYAPFMDALGELVAQIGAESFGALVGPGRADLARLVPELRQAGDEARPPGAADRSVLFQVVARALEAAAAQTGLVVVLEDLHWADTSSRELLAFLLGRLAGPVVLVGTYRSDEVHRTHSLRPLLGHATRSDRVVRIDLAPLTPAEVREQVAAIAGSPLPHAVVDVVVARAEGNPFFVEELVAAGGGDELPPDLAEVLSARLASLPPQAQELVRVAAVAGRRVGHDLLAAAVADSVTDTARGLREAVNHNVLVADDAGAYAFRHALLAEVAYAELLPTERASLHRAYAAALAAHPEWATTAAGAAGELAQHWVLAKEPARALEASVAAAQAAAQTYAFAEAHALYEQSLGLWDQVPHAAALVGCDRAQLLQRAADAALLAGVTPRAVALLQTALDHLDPDAQPGRAAMLYERLARLLSESGEGEASLAASRRAVTLMPTEPSAERAQVIAGEARTLMLAGRYRESCARAQAALEVARAANARREEGYALNTLGSSLARLGQGDPAAVLLREALAIAQAVGSLEDMRRAYNNLSATLEDGMSDPERAAVVALEGAAHLDGLGYDEGANVLRSSAAESLKTIGRWAEADELARTVLASTSRNQAAWMARLAAGTVALRSGDFASAHLHLGEARGLWSDCTYAEYSAQVGIALAELAVTEGRIGDARDLVESTLGMLDGAEVQDFVLRLVSLGLRAEADGRRPGRSSSSRSTGGLGGEALVALARSTATAATGGQASRTTVMGHALEALCEAEWARVGGDYDADAWAKVVETWPPAYPYEKAYARWRHAEALFAAGAKDDAVTVLRQAFSDASRLGAAPLLAEIETLARRARLRLPTESAAPTPAPNRTGLTQRETEVLNLVAAGLTNRQIADTLFMSEKTASVHVSRILTKLGVVNRGQAAAIAHHLDLLEKDAKPTG